MEYVDNRNWHAVCMWVKCAIELIFQEHNQQQLINLNS